MTDIEVLEQFKAVYPEFRGTGLMVGGLRKDPRAARKRFAFVEAYNLGAKFLVRKRQDGTLQFRRCDGIDTGL